MVAFELPPGYGVGRLNNSEPGSPPPDNQGIRGPPDVQLEEYDSDLLGAEKPTRMPPDSGKSRREAFTRGLRYAVSA